METIGVRELRQNASKYLHRVAAGESFTVTERGRTMALLGPAPESKTLYDRLVANGELIPAERPNGVLLDEPLTPVDVGFSASDELQRQREDRF